MMLGHPRGGEVFGPGFQLYSLPKMAHFQGVRVKAKVGCQVLLCYSVLTLGGLRSEVAVGELVSGRRRLGSQAA